MYTQVHLQLFWTVWSVTLPHRRPLLILNLSSRSPVIPGILELVWRMITSLLLDTLSNKIDYRRCLEPPTFLAFGNLFCANLNEGFSRAFRSPPRFSFWLSIQIVYAIVSESFDYVCFSVMDDYSLKRINCKMSRGCYYVRFPEI